MRKLKCVATIAAVQLYVDHTTQGIIQSMIPCVPFFYAHEDAIMVIAGLKFLCIYLTKF